MKHLSIEHYRDTFREYAGRFYTGDSACDHAIGLKYSHTIRVCDEIDALGVHIGCSGRQRQCAVLCALFHDIGRFEQYRRYGTFADFRSENHALLGVRVLDETGMLSGLDSDMQQCIVSVIGVHNAERIGEGLDQRERLFARMLRDADKLDIWRVIAGYYRAPDQVQKPMIELGLPLSDRVSPGVAGDIHGRRVVRAGHVASVTDLKLLQMAWVFDLNFSYSHCAVVGRGYLDAIADSLPPKADIDALVGSITAHAAGKCAEATDTVGERIAESSA
jgi:hypothetical protein